jgi:hypothetical protein
MELYKLQNISPISLLRSGDSTSFFIFPSVSGVQPEVSDCILMRSLHEFQVAENVADELARSDGREVRLEEERELQLPFLLPEDGYSCDVVRGVPQGLAEFLAPLQHAGLCRMSTQPTSSGLWTIYMTHEPNTGVSINFVLQACQIQNNLRHFLFNF